MVLKRKSDDKDSTSAVWFNYAMAFFVTGGIFAVDIIVDKGILDGALIGVLISKVYDGITKQNDYYFPTARNPKPAETNTDESESDTKEQSPNDTR